MRHDGLLLGAVATLLFIPTSGHAFPIIEGVQAASSFSGSAVAMLGAAASVIRAARRKKVVFFSAISVLILALIAAGLLVSSTKSAKDSIQIHNRIPDRLEGVMSPKTQTFKVPSAEMIDWAERHDLFIELDGYQAGKADEGLELIYINKRDDISYQPSNIASFTVHDDAGLRAYVAAADHPIALVSEDAYSIIDKARSLRDHAQYPVRGIWTGDLFTSRIRDDSLPLFQDKAAIHDADVIDIRSGLISDLIPGLISSTNIPAYDLLLARDEELHRIFSARKVLIGNDPHLYGAIAQRLIGAGIPPRDRFAFYPKGYDGLHDDGLEIVPEYLPRGTIKKGAASWAHAVSGNLRVICTLADHCPQFVPHELRVVVDFEQMSRDEARARLEGLPLSYTYAVAAQDRQMSAQAMTAGWWLVNSGHDYIGQMVFDEEFTQAPGEGLFSKLQSWLAGALHTQVERSDWVITFLALGVGVRTVLIVAVPGPFLSRRRGPFEPVGGMAALFRLAIYWFTAVWLSWAWQWLNIMPADLRYELLTNSTEWISMILAAILGLHLTMEFSDRRRLMVGGVVAVAACYLTGLFNDIPAPVAIFIIGSETAATTLLLAEALMRYRRMVLRGRGIILPAEETVEDASLPSKWRLANQASKLPGILVSTSSADQGTVMRLVEKMRGNLIVRSAGEDHKETAMGGRYSSHVIANNADELKCALMSLEDQGCGMAWIQPHIDCDEVFVATSIAPNGERFGIVSGPPGAATEGTKEASRHTVAGLGAIEKKLRRMMILSERLVGGPVLIEAGRKGRHVVLFQVRPMNRRAAIETALYPDGIGAFRLAEDMYVRPSRLTGSVFEVISDGDLIYAGGFLYARRTPKSRRIAASERDIQALEEEIMAATQSTLKYLPGEPDGLRSRLKHRLELYHRVYEMTQTKRKPEHIQTCLLYPQPKTPDVDDLEIDRPAEDHCIGFGDFRSVETREVLHQMALLLTHDLRNLIVAYNDDDDIADLDIREILPLSGEPASTLRAQLPLIDPKSVNEIVAGPVNGTIWPADSKDPPLTPNVYVLAGEELSSAWVQHLHLFTGVISVYGDANSHMGLSARQMAIPYRKVAQDELTYFLRKGSISLD